MKITPFIVAGFLVMSASAQASHELINQPVVSEAPEHLDMHDLQHWLLGYSQVNVIINDGVATITGHVESTTDVRAIIRQVEKTTGVRRVANLMLTD